MNEPPPGGVALPGGAIIAALKASGITYVVSVPDIVTAKGLLEPIAKDPAFRLVRVCKEDEGVSICAALSFCGKRALLLMQQTGLLDSMNALRAIGVEYRNPVCMMVGLLGNEPGANPAQSPKFGVRVVQPLLDVMGIPHTLLTTARDVAAIRAGVDNAYEESFPVAFLVGRSPE
jgi:sulfopyruvate decarboxylase subunit alpha